MRRPGWPKAVIALILLFCCSMLFAEPLLAADVGTNQPVEMEGGESAEAPPAATAEEMQQAEMEALAGLIGMVVGLIVSLILLYKLIVWIYRLVVPKKSAAHLPSADPVGAAATAPANVAAKANSKTPNQCNVVSVSRGQRKLWRFGISGKGRSNLMQEFTELPEENLPVKVVGKGWGDLLNPRLNIAWLASDKVFLRVADFPVCDHEELLSMIELQLDQLSPLPVTQIVWTYEALPSVDGEMQTIVLAIASRGEVERHLGQLEQTGYMADRLELPELHQLLSAHKPDDGVWFLPRTHEDANSLLIAWWYGGTLKNITIANVSEKEQWGAELEDQLAQVAWAGELEGWIKGDPHFHLLADFVTAEEWKPVLEEATGEPVTVDEPLPVQQLAGLAAQKAALGQCSTNLVPVDLLETYRQKFIDSIWMRGIGAVVMMYLFGVLIYFAALEYLKFERNEVNQQVYELSGAYTNALMTKARIEVLQQQIALKYAALESLKAASAELPDGMVMTDFSFSSGRRISLRGTVNAADISKVTDYNVRLKKLEVGGRKLFREVRPHRVRGGGGTSPTMNWDFTADLDSSEI